jgi:WD40 repeat protein
VVEPKERPEVVFNQQINNAEFGGITAEQRLWLTVKNDVRAVNFPTPEMTSPQYSNRNALLTGRGSMESIALGEKYVAVGGLDGDLRLFDATIPPNTKELKPLTSTIDFRNDLRSVALAHDEAYAIVGTESGRAHVVALPEMNLLASWTPHTDRMSNVVFLGPGIFATGGKDRAVRFWTWKDNEIKELWTQRITGEVTSLSASADGRYLTVTGLGERGVHLWDLAQLNRRFAEHKIALDGPMSWNVAK